MLWLHSLRTVHLCNVPAKSPTKVMRAAHGLTHTRAERNLRLFTGPGRYGSQRRRLLVLVLGSLNSSV